MEETFVDSVAWIAIINTRDSLHTRAKSIFFELRKSRFINTEFVLLELANTLSSPNFRNKASVFIEGIRNSEEVEIISADSELFLSRFEL